MEKSQQHLTAWQSRGEIDLALVIALDVSASVTEHEYDLMRHGVANALDTSEVAVAIGSGTHGAIAISVLQWSGFQEQDIKIDWTYVSSRDDLSGLAGQINEMPRRYIGGATDIGGMIDFAKGMIVSTPFESPRKIIDVAGDGTNNVNHSPKIDSDAAAAIGITINGLAVTNKTDDLVRYYTDFVIGGRGAFVEKAIDYTGFKHAMLRKLVREIQTLFT